MAITVATKTLAAIEHALRADQGAKYRTLLRDYVPQAEDAYRGVNEGHRPRLGASLLGRECPRELWYTFRWYTDELLDGRMVRLFNRGHLEEPRFFALLAMVGCTVWHHDDRGRQLSFSAHDGHVGGSIDCALLGVPDYPEHVILGECKTHSDKSFNGLKVDGCRVAKFEHFVQQTMYMGGFSLPRSLYLAVNKNDDELYAELIDFDPELYRTILDRSGRIVRSATPPERVSKTPGWWKCKFCKHAPLCHGDQPPAHNCRTCFYVEVLGPGWVCTHPQCGGPLPLESQRAGCQAWSPGPR